MAKKLSPQLIAAKKRLKQEQKKVLARSAETAVQFFKHNITRHQGFLDTRVKKWPKRKKNTDPGRNILVGKGGGAKLWKSISRSRLSAKRAVIGIKGPPNVYASVHNFGLRAGRGKGFIMPKRQFMGESKVLNRKIVRLIKKHLKKIL